MLDKMICDTIRHSGVPARWAEDLKSEIWLKLLMRTWPVIRETKAFFTAAYKRTRIECRAVLRNARRGQGYGKHLWRERHLELDLK